MEIKELIKQIKKIADTAYCPFSNFKVGCLIETNDNSIFSGHNIENSAFPSSICAEVVAFSIFNMSGKKAKDITKILIYNSSNFISPCGNCRQVMVELANLETKVLLINGKNEIIETNIKKLMPFSFKTKKFN